MSFTIEVEHRLKAVQGLTSPVRARRGLPLLAAGEGVALVITAGVEFGEDQLTEHGRFVDTDLVAEELAACCAGLEETPWTELFPFRPTFELVARHLYGQLSARVGQLSFVQVRDQTFGVNTRYKPTD